MPTRGGMHVDIEVLGDVQIDRTIMRFGEHALEATELWDAIVQVLRQIENIQFLTQGVHGSGGWAPLAASTLEEKKRKGQPEWIERATLALFESLTTEGATGAIFENFGSWMRYGTNIPYAIYQQTGTGDYRGYSIKDTTTQATVTSFGGRGVLGERTLRGMPMRKLINLTQVERRGLVKLIQRFIVTGEVVDPESALAYF